MVGAIMRLISSTYMLLGSLYILIGMALGIGMGMTEDFTLAPLHAHINLVGFVLHMIFGLSYRLIPSLGESRLAKYQFWIYAIFAPILMVGVYLTLTNVTHAVVAIGSLGVFVGTLLFTLVIWQNWLKGN